MEITVNVIVIENNVSIVGNSSTDLITINVIDTPQIITTNYTTNTSGLSAYEVAKNNGFIGSEQQWLNSLIGSGFVDQVLTATSNGQTVFNIGTQPIRHYLIINGVEYYSVDSYTITTISANVHLNWLNEFQLNINEKIILRRG